ncbi:MAG TPA: alanine--tRNA ligase [Synergistetes bacterium]|nr:alanine--tRNA ligase [Synergistota bacterium]
MQWRSGRELRETFLAFFEEKDHRRFPSFPLIPDDPTLLFTIAGMVPFKPYFMGKRKPDFNRATTAQKCVRTNDIDNVGRTARHHTLFEMLGNFSFGDYFKSGATAFAWEFLTSRVGLDPDRLYPTIFKDDEEAFNIWNSEIGVPAERIHRMGEEDNFWSVGPVGPCGPCSELIYDQGPSFSCGRPDCGVGCECDRYLEVWNLVFMQYNRLDDGTLEPLPRQNIDTGMGLERLSSVVQQVSGDFETDLFRPLVDRSCDICGIRYGADKAGDMAARVISDHFRATAFMIADGVLPSNEGRGYVLRRILRRAVRFGRLCGVRKPFLMDLYPVLIEVMGEPYRELSDQRALIEQVIGLEEARFGRTLEQGLGLLEREIGSMAAAKGHVLSGEVAFELYDTFGFPLELTEEVCQESGIAVDRDGFGVEMEKQKERARAGARLTAGSFRGTVFDRIREEYGATDFRGYVSDTVETEVIALVRDGERTGRAEEGEEILLVLSDTPFYGEGGGQAGDRGTIKGDNFSANVLDTLKHAGDLIVHRAMIVSGTVEEMAKVEARVELPRRRSIKAHHTATHLLHEALSRVLGDHVAQAGSLVTDEFLRFDFTHIKPLNRDEINRVENMVNGQVLMNTPLDVMETDMDSARSMGARALFDEKYGERVRVVSVPGFSTELCGGTHVDATGDIGPFRIIREEGIGAGVRRITALAGAPCLGYFRKITDTLAELESTLSVPTDLLGQKVAELLEENRSLNSEAVRLRTGAALSRVDELLKERIQAGPVSVVTARYDGIGADTARSVGDSIKRKIEGVVIVIFTVSGENTLIIAMADKAAVSLGADCVKIVKKISGELGGGGGGRPDMAQAGVKNTSGLDKAIRNTPDMVLSILAEKN